MTIIHYPCKTVNNKEVPLCTAPKDKPDAVMARGINNVTCQECIELIKLLDRQ